MREALAVQAFEEGLKVVNLIDHPSEYAMLQNNLGNALQYASSSHMVENNLRALDAYDEALKVRTRETTPLEYANTIANKANCLWNLPDDPQRTDNGNHANLRTARALLPGSTRDFRIARRDRQGADRRRGGDRAGTGNFGTRRTRAQVDALRRERTQGQSWNIDSVSALRNRRSRLLAGIVASVAGGALGGVILAARNRWASNSPRCSACSTGLLGGTLGVLIGLVVLVLLR